MSQFPIPHNRGDYPYEEEYVPPSTLGTEDRPYTSLTPFLEHILPSLNIKDYPIPYPDKEGTQIINPQGELLTDDPEIGNSLEDRDNVLHLIKKLSQIYGTRI